MKLVKQLISTYDSHRLIVASLIVLTFGCSAAMGQAGMTDLVKAPQVPADIEVPAGNKPFLKGHAIGTQNYVCLPSGWTFVGPQATLFVTYRWLNMEVTQQIATHFLSPNPVENDTPRPTWQSSFDTSAVWGKSIASSSDPQFVAGGAIPWLLLQVVGARRGPAGGSTLSQTTFIQRVNTSGGVKPAGTCDVGATTLVPYTADYFFFYKAGM